MVFAATNGPPFVRDGGTRRDGTRVDLERFLQLTQLCDALDTPGRNIVEPNDVYVLDPTDRPTLTLVTCYPFEFVGHAPHRFIVQAELVGDHERTPSGGSP